MLKNQPASLLGYFGAKTFRGGKESGGRKGGGRSVDDSKSFPNSHWFPLLNFLVGVGGGVPGLSRTLPPGHRPGLGHEGP